MSLLHLVMPTTASIKRDLDFSVRTHLYSTIHSIESYVYIESTSIKLLSAANLETVIFSCQWLGCLSRTARNAFHAKLGYSISRRKILKENRTQNTSTLYMNVVVLLTIWYECNPFERSNSYYQIFKTIIWSYRQALSHPACSTAKAIASSENLAMCYHISVTARADM